MRNKNLKAPRPTFEDALRAFAYFVIMAWAVLFLVYPPAAYVSEIDLITRISWMSITFAGAALAFFGAVFRIDLKMEFPGLIFTVIGPLFYFAAQVYYVCNPADDVDTNARIALVAYSALPALLMFPRIYALAVEASRLKRINSSPLKKIELTEDEQRQPGAGLNISIRRTTGEK